ncbi:MAG: hypothetical protein BMS9Abin01_1834 [Gammaproteobacteria bacterium]|nr:MAG: hypothetical protein BMS9Abin01_1834 [Gammaproteobacteria bacterium]
MYQGTLDPFDNPMKDHVPSVEGIDFDWPASKARSLLGTYAGSRVRKLHEHLTTMLTIDGQQRLTSGEGIPLRSDNAPPETAGVDLLNALRKEQPAPKVKGLPGLRWSHYYAVLTLGLVGFVVSLSTKTQKTGFLPISSRAARLPEIAPSLYTEAVRAATWAEALEEFELSETEVSAKASEALQREVLQKANKERHRRNNELKDLLRNFLHERRDSQLTQIELSRHFLDHLPPDRQNVLNKTTGPQTVVRWIRDIRKQSD